MPRENFWTDRDLARLRRMRDLGADTPAMCERTGRTAKAIGHALITLRREDEAQRVVTPKTAAVGQ